MLVHAARKEGLIEPDIMRQHPENSILKKSELDTAPTGGYSVERPVNTGRSVYKVNIIDSTVSPHQPTGHVYFGSMAHPKAPE